MTTPDPVLQAIARLASDIAALRATQDVQFKRIAELQAEVDLLPASRSRRHLALQPPPPAPKHNGNG